MPHVSISGRHRQTVQDTFHLSIITVSTVVNLQQAVVVLVPAGLVKDAQHHVKPVVYMTVQTRNLNNDAVMRQTVHKSVWKTLCHDVVIIVTRLVAHVQHGFLNVPHLMAQQIDGHHRQGMTSIRHVFRVRIVHAQILPETKRLSV